MKNPKISIVIPAYNYAAYLPSCIDSIVEQTYENWELIVINNGSTDHTAEVLESYTDSRIRKMHIEVNEGPVKAWAMGYRQCSGEYFAMLPADDMFTPQKLERQVEFLNRNPHANCVGTYIDVIDGAGNTTGDEHWMINWINREVDYCDLSQWRWKHHFCIPTGLYERSMCEQAGGIPLDGLTNICDWDFHVRLLAAGANFEVIPERLTKYRWHDSNTSQKRQSAHNQWMYSHTLSFLPALKRRAEDYHAEISACIEGLYLDPAPNYFLEEVPQLWRCAHLEVLLNPSDSLKEFDDYYSFSEYTKSWKVDSENRAAISAMDKCLMTLRKKMLESSGALATANKPLKKLETGLKSGFRKLRKIGRSKSNGRNAA